MTLEVKRTGNIIMPVRRCDRCGQVAAGSEPHGWITLWLNPPDRENPKVEDVCAACQEKP